LYSNNIQDISNIKSNSSSNTFLQLQATTSQGIITYKGIRTIAYYLYQNIKLIYNVKIARYQICICKYININILLPIYKLKNKNDIKNG
jgi:hypothetical protein